MNIITVLLFGFGAVCVISVVYIIYSFLYAHFSKNVHVCSVEDFEKQLIATNDKHIIDVRAPWEFKKYRITGAINIGYPGIHFRGKIKKLDKTKPVMVYCHSGYRSKMVIPIFRKAGFKTIYELNRGISSWKKVNKKC